MTTRTVTERIEIDAPVARVWRHVLRGGWLGFGDDPPSAGRLARIADPSGEGPRDARVTSVEEGALDLEWWPVGRPDDASLVSIRVTEDATDEGPRTTVTVVERAHPGDVGTRRAGWSSCLQALRATVEPARALELAHP